MDWLKYLALTIAIVAFVLSLYNLIWQYREYTRIKEEYDETMNDYSRNIEDGMKERH